MLVLFDQGTPVPIRPFLHGHIVKTAAQAGWEMLQNGAPLAAAEEAGFEVLVTPDKNILYQQNLARRKIAIVVLGSPKWPLVRPHVQQVVLAVNAATPGQLYRGRHTARVKADHVTTTE